MKYRLFIVGLAIIPLICGCSVEKNISTEKEDPKEYSLENVYHWLDGSNLIDGEREDVTERHTDDYEGITQATRFGDITIFEFEENEDTSQFEEIPFAVTKENIGVFVSGFSSEIEGVQKVLEARDSVEDLHKGYYLSAEQQNFVEAFRDDEIIDFQVFTDKFYSLDKNTRIDTFSRFILKEEVTLEGVVVKSVPDLIIYGGEDYNNENWKSIQSEHTQMLPYIIETQYVYQSTVSEQKRYERGEPITVSGTFIEPGSIEEEKQWKLSNVFILE